MITRKQVARSIHPVSVTVVRDTSAYVDTTYYTKFGMKPRVGWREGAINVTHALLVRDELRIREREALAKVQAAVVAGGWRYLQQAGLEARYDQAKYAREVHERRWAYRLQRGEHLLAGGR